MLIKSNFIFAVLFLLYLLIPNQTYAACTVPTNPTCWTGDTRCPDREACWGTDENGAQCVACRSTGVTERLTCSAPLDPNTGEGCNNICGQPGATSNCYTQVSCATGTDCTGISGDGCNYCVAPVCSGGCGTPGCPACPTPTPAPLPAPTLSGGFPGGAACSSNGTTLSYSWDSITGAVRYAIRIDDWANGWNDTIALTGDTIENNLPTTPTSYSRTSNPGATYDAWAHAVDSRGVYSNASNRVLVTCPVPTLPPGVTPTITPTSTPGPTPTPVLGCTSCGVNAQCGGNPPTFPICS